jgi:hypothetical protein
MTGATDIPLGGCEKLVDIEIEEMPTNASDMRTHLDSSPFANTCALTLEMPAFQTIDQMEAAFELLLSCFSCFSHA